jgi:hypothetical protein
LCDTTQNNLLKCWNFLQKSGTLLLTGSVTDRTQLTGEVRGCSQENIKEAHDQKGKR